MYKKIIIGSDHAGFELKEKLIAYLKELDFEVEDKGPFKLDLDDDYPDFIKPVALEVAKDPDNLRGIILGGSGQGEAMVANRIKGIRAAVYYGEPLGKFTSRFEIIKLSREHNNANILSLAARQMTDDEAKEALKIWLETPFSEAERHIRRIRKIES